jgi:tetratricopeptide (TPR) repeat protein/opacity protein-like surface antigen
MKKMCSFSLHLFIFTSLIVLLYASNSSAATTCEPWVARMVSVQGSVEVQRAGQTQWQPAQLNDTYCAGYRIQVGERSRADVALINQPVLRLDQNSTITLGGLKEQRTSLIDLVRGAAHFFSRVPRNLEVNTAFVNAGVEGTEFFIRVEDNQTFLSIFEGRVLASNQAGSLALASGQAAVAERGKPPVLTIVVRPRDAVQWALYYPPALYFRPEEFPAGPDWQGMVRNSIEAYTKGDYQGAFEALKGAPENITDPRFFAYRASLLLGVGRFDEASKDIERSLSLNPKYSDALALQSIIAVVQNEPDRALTVGRQAVEADPKSASALIALSYAQQSNFDLEGARNSLKQAVQVSPENALAWARLAELHMSFAELDEALEAANKAVALNPNLSRTQTVLGYAYLLQVQTTESKAAFEKAIELDQADPLSRLGLGLAKIRESDLPEGRREIEIAASLDPNNSIVRSYLGKAYYEEKRTGLDEKEYSIAKELDPKDPTPWFYDAIQKQTTNRPVEALQDIQKAIELNDNRAVYRSRLQLDSDLAARSASLARIFSDLGFQQLALVEGWKSVNTDPTNFSAHRFLADSYSILPRHEIARVSELLQSQLLQPLNMTPIQPRLAESNLFLVSAGGPGALSFNEFNPLFNRNGVTFQTSGLAGENSTYAGEGVFAGIYKNVSFSVGGFHYQTNGFHRPGFTLNGSNTDQRDAIGNAFVQLEVSPQTSVQAEYRYRNNERGDLLQRFFSQDFFPGERNTEERHTARFGARHSFSPDSILLGSFTYQHADVKLKDEEIVDFPDDFVAVKRPENAVSAEVQHLFRSSWVNLTTGVGHFNIHGFLSRDIGLGPLPLFIIHERQSLDLKHTNVYAYSYMNPIKNLTVTLGVSGDFTRGESPDTKSISQANPKFGITWNPVPDTTLRAAAFRVLKRTLITDATLEPTQVAGFNQFYDDFNGTKAWRYGAGVDQKFTKGLFGGLEFSKRDLETRSIGLENAVVKEDVDEYLSRIYLFWAPHPWLALRTEYMFEQFRSEGLAGEPKKLNTHGVPLGLNFFHPSGVSAFLTGTFYNQDIKLADARNGRDDFWLVDLGINYRLPKRYGFITVGATNLFDKKFKFFERDSNNARIRPNRMILGKITLALP